MPLTPSPPSVQVQTLEDCEVACLSMQAFRCEALAYSWQDYTCQLSAKPYDDLQSSDIETMSNSDILTSEYHEQH